MISLDVGEAAVEEGGDLLVGGAAHEVAEGLGLLGGEAPALVRAREGGVAFGLDEEHDGGGIAASEAGAMLVGVAQARAGACEVVVRDRDVCGEDLTVGIKRKSGTGKQRQRGFERRFYHRVASELPRFHGRSLQKCGESGSCGKPQVRRPSGRACGAILRLVKGQPRFSSSLERG